VNRGLLNVRILNQWIRGNTCIDIYHSVMKVYIDINFHNGVIVENLKTVDMV
jgi:hypothetical protein